MEKSSNVKSISSSRYSGSPDSREARKGEQGCRMERDWLRHLPLQYFHIPPDEREIHFLVQIFGISIKLRQNAAVNVAVYQDHCLPSYLACRVLVGDLYVKVGILASSIGKAAFLDGEKSGKI